MICNVKIPATSKYIPPLDSGILPTGFVDKPRFKWREQTDHHADDSNKVGL